MTTRQMMGRVSVTMALVAITVASIQCTARAEDANQAPPSVSESDAIPPPKRGSENQFAEFTRTFEDAIDSIDRTNRELERVLQQETYGDPGGIVDELMVAVRTLEDRLQPGNATEQKIDRIVTQIDAQVVRVNSDEALSADEKRAQSNEFNARKGRYLKARSDLSAAYENVRKLAEDLKGHRRTIAYSLLHEHYDKGAASLEATIAKINKAVNGLRARLDDIRPALTN